MCQDKLNVKFLEIAEKLCYLNDTTAAKGGTVDSVIARIRSGWSKAWELKQC